MSKSIETKTVPKLPSSENHGDELKIDNGFRTNVLVCRASFIEEVKELVASEATLLVKVLNGLLDRGSPPRPLDAAVPRTAPGFRVRLT